MRELPEHWTQTTLGEVAKWGSGGTPSRAISEYFGGSIPWFKTGELNDGVVTHAEEFLTAEGVRNSSAKVFPKGSVLIAMYGATIGRCGILGIDGSTNQACAVAQPYDYVDARYLFFYLKSQRQGFIEKGKGGAQPNISQAVIKEHPFPLAPLAEQKRIVAKLDVLFAHLDQLKARLENIPNLLKQFRQAILTQAVNGKLTEEWRKSQKDLTDPKAMIEDLIVARQREKANVKINKLAVDVELDIPQGWHITRLLNIADIIGGVTKGRKLNGKKTIQLPYLRVANVQDGYLDLKEIKSIDVLPDDLEKYRLAKDDILFTEGGDRDKLGRGALWKNEIPDCIHQNHIFRARAFKECVSPSYISLFTKSDSARAYFFENASQTVNLASINLTTLSNVPIAIPSVEEQTEIIRRVESLYAVAERIEINYNRMRGKIERLPQSILSKAFRGELVLEEYDEDLNSEVLIVTEAESVLSTKKYSTKHSR